MGAPRRPNDGIIGIIQGRLNKKKLSRTYNESYNQIRKLWNLLPEGARTNLKSENGHPDEMEVDDSSSIVSLVNKKIENLKGQVKSLQGRNASYKDKMTKKKLKNQLRKKKKLEEKHILKEEKRKRNKELKEKIKAEKMKNGGIAENPLEKRLNVITNDVGNLSSDEEKPVKPFKSKTEVVEDSDEEVSKNKVKKLDKENKIEDFTVKGIEEEKNTSGLSNKKLKLLQKKKLKAEKKREKKKLLKIKHREEAEAKEQTIKIEEAVAEPKQEESNKDTEILFNKIDFTEEEKRKFKKEKQKTEKDPVKALSKIEGLNQRITDLKVSGQEEKAAAIQSKQSWKNAILKADGVKVKDDVKLLKKTIRRKEKKKSRSKDDWQKRNDIKEKKMADAQKKRKENISKKKKEKKQKKIKKSIKKGRVVI